MSKKEKYILCGIATILLVMLAILGIVTIKYTNKSSNTETSIYIAPFVAPDFDANAVEGIPKNIDEPSYQDMKMEDFSFKIFGEPKIENDELVLYLTNLEENPSWMKVRIYDENGNVLGESGIVRNGEYLRNVHINSAMTTGQTVVARMFFYEPETYMSMGAFNLKLVCK